MPLSAKYRIELFLPDSVRPAYAELINRLENEIAYAFGGCTEIQGTKGLYRSKGKRIIQDRIHLLFTDVELGVNDWDELEAYVDTLQEMISGDLNEEKILITVHSVFHQTKKV